LKTLSLLGGFCCKVLCQRVDVSHDPFDLVDLLLPRVNLRLHEVCLCQQHHLFLLLLLLLQDQSLLFLRNLFLHFLDAGALDELDVEGLFVLDLLGDLSEFLSQILQVHLERIEFVFLLNLEVRRRPEPLELFDLVAVLRHHVRTPVQGLLYPHSESFIVCGRPNLFHQIV